MVDLHQVHALATAAELETDGLLHEVLDPWRYLLGVVAAGEPGEWRLDAACRGLDRATFFPGQGEPLDKAMDICRTCPVRRECAEHALARPDLSGIWGGMSDQGRRVERRRRRGGGKPQ